jgi:hypothetical protein
MRDGEFTSGFDVLLKQGIELYSGREVVSLLRHDDPRVEGSYALRVVLRKKPMNKTVTVDFLICAHPKPMQTPEDVCDLLEETGGFSTWPPKSGSLKFFL